MYRGRKGSVGSCLYPFLKTNVRIFENCKSDKAFG